jgi:hypothetical protein
MVPRLLNVGGKRHRSFRVEEIFLVHPSLNQQKQGHQEPSMIGPSYIIRTNNGVKRVRVPQLELEQEVWWNRRAKQCGTKTM